MEHKKFHPRFNARRMLEKISTECLFEISELSTSNNQEIAVETVALLVRGKRCAAVEAADERGGLEAVRGEVLAVRTRQAVELSEVQRQRRLAKAAGGAGGWRLIAVETGSVTMIWL